MDPTRGGTGLETPVGDTMRQDWVPALSASDLPTNGGRAVRVKLLGERLVAFRTASGRIGLLAEPCSHAGASLVFGRVEGEGLRCSAHGWKYDLEGHCVDAPDEPPGGELQRLCRHHAYPCAEQGGTIWAYMGPPGEPPALPNPAS